MRVMEFNSTTLKYCNIISNTIEQNNGLAEIYLTSEIIIKLLPTIVRVIWKMASILAVKRMIRLSIIIAREILMMKLMLHRGVFV